MNETEKTEATDNVANEDITQDTTSATEADSGLFGANDTQDKENATDGEQEAERPKWLKGVSLRKFNDGEELAEGYLELEKKFFEKHEVPETYEYQGLLDEAGLEVLDQDFADDFFAQAKEQGYSQKQIDFALTNLGKWAAISSEQLKAQVIQDYGPPNNREVIAEEMQKAWGSDFEKNSKAVHEYGQKNFHSDVYNSLRSTSEGIKYLHAQMKKAVGANPVDSSNAVGSDGMTLEKVKALTGDPRYWDTNHPEHDSFGRYVREQFNRFSND